LINVANRNHEKARVWLSRHFGDRLRFHQLDRLADNHIDSIVLPLAPGTLLLRDRSYLAKLPVFLRNWKIIVPPPPSECQFPKYEEDVLVLTSPYIDMNVLSLDESTVVVNSLCPELIRCLEKNGFTVIPVRHRHRRLFAGGFHCFTLDTVRTGGAEDYT
jgi:glycine amidinotransferase